jgi:hypothetical protein
MVSSVDDGIEFAEEFCVRAVFVVLEVGFKGCCDRLGMLRVQDSIDVTRPGAK